MGLLDFSSTPEGMQGLALLAAAAPSMEPTNFAGRLANAGNTYRGLLNDQLKQQFTKAQIDDMQQQIGLRNLQADALRRNNGIIGSILGQFTGQTPQADTPSPAYGGAPIVGATGAGPAGGAPTASGMPIGGASVGAAPAAGPSMLGGLSPDAVAALKLAGIDISDIYKWAHDPQKMEPGSVNVNRLTGQTTTIPSVSQDGKASQLIPDPSAPGGFRVIAPNGALPTYQAYSDAGEASKARFDPLDPKFVDRSTGLPVGGSRLSYVTGGAAPAPAPAGGNLVLPNGVKLNPELQAAILADAAKNGITNPQISAQFQNAPGMKSTTFGWQPDGAAPGQGGRLQLQSPAEAEAAKVTATKAAESGQAYKDALDSKVEEEFQLVNRNKQILPLLDKFKTGGMLAEDRLHFGNAIANSGLLPEGMKQTLGNWIASGDTNAGKVIENQLASAGILNMLQTLDKEGKPNRAIFQAVQKAQEGLNSGNTTLKDVFELQNRLYGIHYDEQQAITKAIKDGSYDPRTWAGDYAAVRHAGLNQPAAPLPSATTATQTAAPTRIKGDADYNALPSGALFVDPFGKTRRKP